MKTCKDLIQFLLENSKEIENISITLMSLENFTKILSDTEFNYTLLYDTYSNKLNILNTEYKSFKDMEQTIKALLYNIWGVHYNGKDFLFYKPIDVKNGAINHTRLYLSHYSGLIDN